VHASTHRLHQLALRGECIAAPQHQLHCLHNYPGYPVRSALAGPCAGVAVMAVLLLSGVACSRRLHLLLLTASAAAATAATINEQFTMCL